MKITFEDDSGQKVIWFNLSESDLRKYFNLSALAQANGLAESTVRSRLHRGMPLLLALNVEPE
ncbi:transcriptional regulator [Klebsiella michiganensis]|uniref:helix-turn-helix domain-containing protein n=1 Tax=Klebsiella michiganensis TaxID=1134687 RepID=UPI001CCAF522|nr:helix-turn-helix domain-containing protein [Klebsiella michiganensis]MBZ7458996.1 transcriptional regulator [Klebsiella michiganensis]